MPAPIHHASSFSLDIFSSCSSSLQAPLHCIFMTRAMHRLWCAPYSREHRTRGAWVTEPGFCWPILFVGFCILGSVPCGFYATEAGGTKPRSALHTFTAQALRQAGVCHTMVPHDYGSKIKAFYAAPVRSGHVAHGRGIIDQHGPSLTSEPA